MMPVSIYLSLIYGNVLPALLSACRYSLCSRWQGPTSATGPRAVIPSRQRALRYTTLPVSIAPLVLLLGGCIGPPVLEMQVLGYDQVAETLNEKLLLLNIARVHNDETVHFTSTSSIAATFDWTTTVGA